MCSNSIYFLVQATNSNVGVPSSFGNAKIVIGVSHFIHMYGIVKNRGCAELNPYDTAKRKSFLTLLSCIYLGLFKLGTTTVITYDYPRCIVSHN